jgi:hypothetical protein
MSPRPSPPHLLVVAAFSRHDGALTWARQRLEQAFGRVAFASPPFAFHHTAYYEATMGAGLHKLFHVFADLVAPDSLPRIKLATNEMEAELAAANAYPEQRPLNLDPGLLTLGKFTLATTKDQAHRLYLGQGIYGEVTLYFQAGEFVPWPWTYADYREPDVRAFLKQARDYYAERLTAAKG